MVKDFTSYEEVVADMTEFTAVVQKHAELGNCLLKGLLNNSLKNESRAGQTKADQETSWAVFDIDGLPYKPAEFLAIIGFEGADYLIQYSASAGIVNSKGESTTAQGMDRYHIFFMLDKPYSPRHLKEWLKSLNLNLPQLKNHMELTASGMSLRWPLDITVCQNDKLIYIAPPTCGKGVTDTIAGSRYEYHTGTTK